MVYKRIQHEACGHIFDLASVTVVARYAECSTFHCPGCGAMTDDRPGLSNGCKPVSESATHHAIDKYGNIRLGVK